jgi:hypothetical protein
MALVGRYFLGVVASQDLSPESTQDVARVNVSRARIAVADGAGDSGGTAGDWALLLALSYAAAHADDDAGATWLQRAAATWRGASNIDGLLRPDLILKRNELKLLTSGVHAAFAGATFNDGGRCVVVSWQAAGDCEVMLFREGRLAKWAPLKAAEDFTSVVRGLSSSEPDLSRLQSDSWQLVAGDTLLISTDAVARWILASVGADYAIAPETAALLECRRWDDLRGVISRNRKGGGLEPDDVAIVRVRIEEELAIGTGFQLVEEGTAVQYSAPQTDQWSPALAPTTTSQEPAAPIVADGTPRPTPSAPITRHAVKPARVSLHAVYGVIASAALILGMVLGQRIGMRERPGAMNPIPPTSGKPDVARYLAPASSGPTSQSDTAIHPAHSEMAPPTGVVRPTVHGGQHPSALLSEQHVAKADAPPKSVVRRKGDEANGERTSDPLPERARARAPEASKKTERLSQEAESRTAVADTANAKPTSAVVADAPKGAEESERATSGQSTTSASPIEGSAGHLNTKPNAPAVANAPPRETPVAATTTPIAPPVAPGEQVKETSVSTPMSDSRSPMAREQRLTQGAHLYGTPKEEKWPLLKIEAKNARCLVEEEGTTADRVTIRGWVRGASTAGDTFSKPTKAWTAPIGSSGSEFLGSFRAETRFHRRDTKTIDDAVWTEVEVAAYRLK